MFLTRRALANPILVLMVSIAVVVLSIIAVTRLPVELFPNITLPVITVITSYSGATPETVERAVTLPIEQAITRVSGVTQIVSTSRRGTSTVQMQFAWGTNLDVAQVSVIQNVQRVMAFLPPGVGQPFVNKFDISNTPVAQVVAEGANLTPRELYQLAFDTLEPQIERLPGAATAFIRGGMIRQLNIDVDPRKLEAVGLTLPEVDAALRRSNALVPSGSLRNTQIDYQLNVPTLLTDVKAIAHVVVATRHGVPVHIGDIADVQDATADQTQIVRIDGKPGVILSLVRQPGANAIEVVNALQQALPRFTGLPHGVSLRVSFDQSRYIREAMLSLTREAGTGAILTFLVIMIFLPNPRNLFIVGLGIPLSAASALLLLFLNGQTLNVFTLGGLTLAMGRLVDDAIVVRENITRHLAVPGTPVLQAVVEATEEVGVPVFASTATTIAVFFPVVFLTGISQRLFVPMALTIVFAMAASYVVSMTIDPVLSVRLFKRRPADEEEGRPNGAGGALARLTQISERLESRLDDAYVRALSWTLARPRTVGIAIVVIFVLSLLAARGIGTEFFPPTDESQFSINVQAPQGTAVPITASLAAQVADLVRRAVPPGHIVTLITDAGVPTGGPGFGNVGPNFAQVSVRLAPPSQRALSTDEVISRVRRALAGKFPGVQMFFSTGGLQREIVNFGSAAPIDVQLLGFDQSVGQQVAQQVAAIVAATPGTADVRISPRGEYPTFTVHINIEKAAQLGLTSTSIANAINMAMAGNVSTASKFIDPLTGAEYNIVVRLKDQYRSHPDDLANIPLEVLADPAPPGTVGAGIPILLGDVARTTISSEPLQISRKNAQRVIDVIANVTDRPLGAVSTDIVQQIDRIQFPPGFTYHMAGQTEQQQGAFSSLFLAMLLALMLVYMIMASQFQSLVDPFVIMFTVPLGLIGVIWMLVLTHTTLSIMSFMGIITMVGIVVSNGILLVDFANKLQARGLALREAVLRAGRTRLRPILMTALATILAMIPMAIGLGEGGETNAPLARAVIGGLTVSTGLTLLFIPMLYMLFEQWRPRSSRERS